MYKKTKTAAPTYEDLATTYQVAETALLNSVLKACGIADKRKRRKICEEFMFWQGIILHDGAIQQNGKWYAPVLGYAELQGNPDKGIRKTKKFYKLSIRFPGFHEYALGNSHHFFED